jgi:cytosine/adenosine deaminase-related metal-dependent hydrolase
VRPQPEDILADATEGGSRAVNMQATIGSLEVGKKADLFVLNTLKPYLVPHGRLVSAVIHGGHPSDIESVMVDGQFIMRDNKVLTIDEAAVLREADAAGRRIWSKVGPVSVPRMPRPPK